MKRILIGITLTLSCLVYSLHAWKSTEATGEQPIFFGILTSQEGNVFNVTNISIGRSATDREKVILYEMPKNIHASAGTTIPVNPAESLTTAQLELAKIAKITVPHPTTLWTWKDPQSTRTVPVVQEFIELIVTWRSGSTVHYLLKLGPQNTKRPIKIYCDVVDKPMQGTRQDGTLFCASIKKADLRKKGAPFPSVQTLIIDEPCFKVPTENGSPMQSKKMQP